MKRVALPLILTAGVAVASNQPHVHGVQYLGLVIDGAQVSAELSGPVADYDGQQDSLTELAPLTFSAGAQCTQTMFQSSAAAVGHDGHSGHADVRIEMTYACDNPDQLSSLQFPLFDSFAEIKELQVTAFINGQPKVATLTPESPQLTW